MISALIFLRFTQQGILNFKESPGRIKALADVWKEDPYRVDIRAAHYLMDPEWDTMLRVEAFDIKDIYAAVKHLESAGNVRCKVVPCFPLYEVEKMVK